MKKKPFWQNFVLFCKAFVREQFNFHSFTFHYFVLYSIVLPIRIKMCVWGIVIGALIPFSRAENYFSPLFFGIVLNRFVAQFRSMDKSICFISFSTLSQADLFQTIVTLYEFDWNWTIFAIQNKHLFKYI